MKRDDLLKIVDQEPFQPFRITTTADESFDVVHRNMIIVTTHDVTIGLPHPQKQPPTARELVWIDLEQIVAAQPMSEAS